MEEIIKAIEKYKSQYGLNKTNKIIERLNNAKTFNENIDICFEDDRVPQYEKTFYAIVMSADWKFGFANKRKIYFGALWFILMLMKKNMENNFCFDENDYRFLQALQKVEEYYDKTI